MGALQPGRLAEFQRRFRDMPADALEGACVPPFMYGTHYSTPGYVMYWLVRAAPGHMLRLQNGRFDAPDRLFLSIEVRPGRAVCLADRSKDRPALIPPPHTQVERNCGIAHLAAGSKMCVAWW